MSFILDALRKSETERQHKGSAEFVDVPTSSDRREGPPAWLWVLGVLLLVNLAVLVGILLRPDIRAPEPIAGAVPVGVPAAVPAVVPAVVPQQEVQPPTDFASRVAAARENAPAIEAPAAQPVANQGPRPTQDASASTTSTVSTNEPTTSFAARPAAALPTIHEVRAQGLVSLPDLHVDIHVYSETPGDRFVFINMNKQREGSRLSEGPLVEEITTDGVVLSMNGVTFLLPRD